MALVREEKMQIYKKKVIKEAKKASERIYNILEIIEKRNTFDELVAMSREANHAQERLDELVKILQAECRRRC
jgi:hypothetical protein